jgi:hypothetical protein
MVSCAKLVFVNWLKFFKLMMAELREKIQNAQISIYRSLIIIAISVSVSPSSSVGRAQGS